MWSSIFFNSICAFIHWHGTNNLEIFLLHKCKTTRNNKKFNTSIVLKVDIIHSTTSSQPPLPHHYSLSSVKTLHPSNQLMNLQAPGNKFFTGGARPRVAMKVGLLRTISAPPNPRSL